VYLLKKVFIALSAMLLTSFMLLDLTRMGDSTPLKYLSITLCFLFSLKNVRTSDGMLTALALAFTLGADWFLLVLNRHYIAGLLLFIAVQLIYCARLALKRGTVCKKLIPLRVAPVLLLPFTGALITFSGVYFVNLCCNSFEAWQLRERAFAAGLTLFMCCDLCVGAYNLGVFTAFTSVGMWMFYLPSQVCIVMSAEDGRTNTL